MKDRQDMEGLWRSSKKYILIVAFGVVLYELLENLTVVRQSISGFFGIITPIFIGIVIAFIANMPMRFLENRVFSKWRPCTAKRGVCLILAMLFIIAILTAIVLIIGPRLAESVKLLADDSDKYYYSLTQWGRETWERINLSPEIMSKIEEVGKSLVEKLDTVMSGLASWLVKFTVSAAGIVIDLVFAIIISFYGLAKKEELIMQTKKFTKALFSKKTAERIIYIGSRTNESLHNYVYGMLIECTILGLLCFVGMTVLKFPFALLISVLVGVSQMIPIVGPWVSAVVGAFIVFVVSPEQALWFLVFVIGVQQLEGNLIYPRVVGNAVGISGLWVMIAVLLGGGLFGLTGAILCVPVMAVIYTLTQEWVNDRLEEKRRDGEL